MLAASATTNIAWIIGVVFVLGWLVVRLRQLALRSKAEVGSEIELAPEPQAVLRRRGARRPAPAARAVPRRDPARHDGRRPAAVLDARAGPPGGQDAASWDKQFATWGSRLFAPTADDGFNCAGCHGGMTATGGVAEFVVTDPLTNEVQAVIVEGPGAEHGAVPLRRLRGDVHHHLRPARHADVGLGCRGRRRDERPADARRSSHYIKSITVAPESCTVEDTQGIDLANEALDGLRRRPVCRRPRNRRSRPLPKPPSPTVPSGSLGEALFNLDLASGAYSCARCHTPGWSYGDPGTPGSGSLGWNLTGGVDRASTSRTSRT